MTAVVVSGLSVADALDRAADLIEPEGAWGQGFNGGVLMRPGCFCIGTAIDEVIRRNGSFGGNVYEAVFRVAPFHSVLGMTLWNDTPERTQPEVVAKLREAAALAREQDK